MPLAPKWTMIEIDSDASEDALQIQIAFPARRSPLKSAFPPTIDVQVSTTGQSAFRGWSASISLDKRLSVRHSA